VVREQNEAGVTGFQRSDRYPKFECVSLLVESLSGPVSFPIESLFYLFPFLHVQLKMPTEKKQER
jgi:hypothetical protein